MITHLTATLSAVLPTALPSPLQIDPVPKLLVPDVTVIGVVDLDGDGRAEILGRDDDLFFDDVIRAFRAESDGSLRGLGPVAEDGGQTLIVDVHDFDGDGQVELLGYRAAGTAQDPFTEVVVFTRPGGTGLLRPVVIGRTNPRHRPLATDFDRDGDLDVLTYPDTVWSIFDNGQEDRAKLLENLGFLNFGVETDLQSSLEDFDTMTPLDLDADGDVDFAAITDLTGELALLRSDGGQLQVESVPGTLDRLISLAVADIDADGAVDVVASRRPLNGTADVSLHRFNGNASGRVDESLVILPETSGISPRIEFGQFSTDDALDLLIPRGLDPSATPSAFDVMTNSGLGFLRPPVEVALGGGIGGDRPIVADLDGDGDDDVIHFVVPYLSSGEYAAPTVFMNEALLTSVPVFRPGARMSGASFQDLIIVGEVGIDGLVDVLGELDGGLAPTGTVGWAGGTVGSPQLEAVRVALAEGLGGPVVVADFDGPGTGTASVILAGDGFLREVVTTGDTTFAAPVLLGSNPFNPSFRPQAIDWDGDGDLDLVGTGTSTGDFIWMERLGQGQFLSPATLYDLTAGLVADYRVGDLNGDGALDLVVRSGFFSSTFSWLPGLGGDALGSESPLPGTPGFVHVFDVNSDGFDDIVWFDGGASAEIVFLPGSASGPSSSPAQTLVADAGIRGPIVQVDLDGDFDLDLVVLSATTGEVRGFSNQGGSFGSAPTLTLEPMPAGNNGQIIAADLGDDGDLDLLIGNRYWVENLRSGDVGTSICGPAVPNESGRPGRILARGSSRVSESTLRLHALDLPDSAIGIFIASQVSTLATPVNFSIGQICLGGPIGRYSAPDQVQFQAGLDQFRLELDLGSIPSPTGFVSALPGATWYFQAWYRDVVPAGATSNFTDAVEVLFN